MEPASHSSRQFIAAVFLADVPRIASLLRFSPHLAHDRFARGDTALHHASRNGDTVVVSALVSGGSDPNAISDVKQFPLYCAAGHGHVDTVSCLLSLGADPTLQLEDGKTVAEWLKPFVDRDARFARASK